MTRRQARPSELPRAGFEWCPRLVDVLGFLDAASIVVDFEAPSKEAAIAQLVGRLAVREGLRREHARALLVSALEREADTSTCFGAGVAIPHGDLPTAEREDGGTSQARVDQDTPQITGVMALSAPGLDFETPDGCPVHCVVLLATPCERRHEHLQVLAALARTLTGDDARRRRLFSARSPQEASAILSEAPDSAGAGAAMAAGHHDLVS